MENLTTSILTSVGTVASVVVVVWIFLIRQKKDQIAKEVNDANTKNEMRNAIDQVARDVETLKEELREEKTKNSSGHKELSENLEKEIREIKNDFEKKIEKLESNISDALTEMKKMISDIYDKINTIALNYQKKD
jgi:DNA anti-recombination protein RmuC